MQPYVKRGLIESNLLVRTNYKDNYRIWFVICVQRVEFGNVLLGEGFLGSEQGGKGDPREEWGNKQGVVHMGNKLVNDGLWVGRDELQDQ